MFNPHTFCIYAKVYVKVQAKVTKYARATRQNISVYPYGDALGGWIDGIDSCCWRVGAASCIIRVMEQQVAYEGAASCIIRVKNVKDVAASCFTRAGWTIETRVPPEGRQQKGGECHRTCEPTSEPSRRARSARPKAPSNRPHDQPVQPCQQEQVPRRPHIPWPLQLFISPPGHLFWQVLPHRPASQVHTPELVHVPVCVAVFSACLCAHTSYWHTHDTQHTKGKRDKQQKDRERKRLEERKKERDI